MAIHHVNGGVKHFISEEDYAKLFEESKDAFEKGDFAEVIRALDRHFGQSTWSLKSLFRDEQRRIIREVLQPTLAETAQVLIRLHQDHSLTMQFLNSIGAPMPRVFQTLKELLHGVDLRWETLENDPSPEEIRSLLEQGAPELRLSQSLTRISKELTATPLDVDLIQLTLDVIDRLQQSSAQSPLMLVHLQTLRRSFWQLWQTIYPEQLAHLRRGNVTVEDWLSTFIELGDRLGFQVEPLQSELKEITAMPTPSELLETIFAERRAPQATYRLQLHHGFPFGAALAQLDYLRDLGISDVYASPILQARPGSPHGYDVCDHSRINVDLGTEEELDALVAALHERGMGLIIDIVPNHMGIGHVMCRWWLDVLENGPSSIYADHFDIAWHPVNPNIESKVLLPILEDQYGRVLEQGLIRLAYDQGSFHFQYHDHFWPVAPGTYDLILACLVEPLSEKLGEEDKHLQELQSILTALSYLPERTERDRKKIDERNREKEIIKDRLHRLVEGCAPIREVIEARIVTMNGNLEELNSFDELDGLLDAQAYRPAFWKVATEEINYRRFFDVNDLAALCVEHDHVFHETHQVLLRLLAQRKANGLRIDHPDGLWAPTAYFRQLQTEHLLARARQLVAPRELPAEVEDELKRLLSIRFQSTEGEQHSHIHQGWPLYVVAEKILSEDEELPADWPVDGTTGYDFLNLASGLFVEKRNEEVFQRIHSQFTGRTLDFAELVNAMKKRIMQISMASEINALAHQLDRISERNRRYRDFTLNSLTFVIREILSCLSVYRTYVTETGEVSDRDREFINAAVEAAKKLNPRTDKSIFHFVRDTLLLSRIEEFDQSDRPALVDWALKFQQVSGPVMAKGVEDTSLYIYNRLISLNEVGSEPQLFGTTLEEFHHGNQYRHEHWPCSMLTTSTHDTKRSEDVRARLHVLSEIPGEWERALNQWHSMNLDRLTFVEDNQAPDRNDEYLLYQTVLAAWPPGLTPESEEMIDFRERIITYMQKATKEAKVNTSWINPNQEYDQAVEGFTSALLTSDSESSVLQELFDFQEKLAFFGYVNSLSQVLLKLASPGAPDFYQGTELWDFSLVDPDNRRPVDYDHRRRLLQELQDKQESSLAGLIAELTMSMSDGRIKLFVTQQTLHFRREHSELFVEGDYQPVTVTGSKEEHVCAFLRSWGDQQILVVVPRLVYSLLEGEHRQPVGDEIWGDTRLDLPVESGSRFRNIFTGEELQTGEHGLAMHDVLRIFPVILAVRC